MAPQQTYLTPNEKRAIAEIRQGVARLVGKRLKRYTVFGSKARGDFDPESDVDLAVVVDGLDGAVKRRIIDLVTASEMRHLVVVSSLVLSWKDFVDLRRRERRIVLDIETEGIPA
jgi:predicted nucleotidyltransferase